MTKLGKRLANTAVAAVVAGLAALMGAGCDEVRPRPALPIDSVVELRVAEDGTGFLIVARTRRTYRCLGFHIVHRLRPIRIADKEWLLELLGIEPPSGVCAAALGPATATMSLGPLPDGPHPVAIRVNGESVTAVLTVTANAVSVEGGDGPWTEWPERQFSR